jgi:RNase P subunit RPR2
MSVVSVSKSIVAQKQRKADYCHRCGGLMVPEQVFEIRSIDWHCVSCGERIDPVILAHRQVHRPEESACEDAKKLSADHGKRRLN